jgi:pimeloyl-ACP methyl ester carboxylesterase
MLGELLRQAHASGRAGEFIELLAAAARFRRLVGEEETAAVPAARPTVLAAGPERPAVICLPSVLANAGPHQFARFAAHFRGKRDVAVLPLLGFGPGEPLPATMEAAASALAAVVREHVGSSPFILLGYSSGGLLAQAVARRLEGTPAAPRGLVLLDTYPLDKIGPAVIGGMLERAGELIPLDDTRLTAMGGYLDLLTGWRPTAPEVPSAPEAPTLLAWAAQPLPDGLAEGRARGNADGEIDEIELVGDHFTILEKDAESTALMVDDWLSAKRIS